MLIHQHVAGIDVVGSIFPIPNLRGEGVILYNATGSAIVKGEVVLMGYDDTSGREASAIVAATMAYGVRTAIAMEAIADGAIGRFQISGLAEALVDDTGTLAAGRFLEVLNTGTYLVDDGTTTRNTTSVGVLKDAVTAAEGGGSAVLKTVMLIPEAHTIAAS